MNGKLVAALARGPAAARALATATGRSYKTICSALNAGLREGACHVLRYDGQEAVWKIGPGKSAPLPAARQAQLSGLRAARQANREAILEAEDLCRQAALCAIDRRPRGSAERLLCPHPGRLPRIPARTGTALR